MPASRHFLSLEVSREGLAYLIFRRRFSSTRLSIEGDWYAMTDFRRASEDRPIRSKPYISSSFPVRVLEAIIKNRWRYSRKRMKRSFFLIDSFLSRLEYVSWRFLHAP